MPFGQEGLVVTWSIPVPAEAKITCASPETSRFMDELGRAAGGEIPKRLDRRYTNNVVRSDNFNSTILWSLDELERWENRFEIKLEEGPAGAFRRYFDSGHVVFGTLVNHPEVSDPSRWELCSIILQRALIVFAEGRETVVFRSYFHSRTSNREEAVNFVPARDIEVSFQSESIWFPLALTEFIAERKARVALDVLTPSEVRSEGSCGGLDVKHRGFVSTGKRVFHTMRLAGDLKAGQGIDDLKLRA